MAKLKFAANLNFLFVKETPKLVERYALARQHGFRWVECAFPYVVPLSEIKAAKENAGVEQILINSFPGNTANKEFGFAALPGKAKEFRESIEKSIEYARALDCKRIHVMSGCINTDQQTADMQDCYKSSLRYAANRFQQEDIIGLIEPINHRTIPDYFMNDPQRAFEIINEIGHPNLRYQLDIFHLQILMGDLTRNIEKFWPVVEHIQIAQAPNRTEPMLEGEISYPYIFDLLEKHEYSGYIGLEHLCTSANTAQCLDWIKSRGYEM